MMEGSCNYSILLWLAVTCLSTKFNPENGILLEKNGNWAEFFFFQEHQSPFASYHSRNGPRSGV